MTQQDTARALRERALVTGALRQWFSEHGYLEIATPALVPSPAVEEHLFALQAGDLYLRTSPEMALKKVTALGLPRIYEIAPCFRDREASPWHRQEFLMLEWYRAGAELTDLMDEVQALIAAAAQALGVPAPETWRRTTVREVFEQATGIDLAIASSEELGAVDGEGWDEAFTRAWVSKVEPTLTEPMFIAEWPASQCALAEILDDGQWPIARRFEVYLGGHELANAFFELRDPIEQHRRIIMNNQCRVAGGEKPHPVDKAFIEAVGQLPKMSGIAMGLERLVAVLAGWKDIHATELP